MFGSSDAIASVCLFARPSFSVATGYGLWLLFSYIFSKIINKHQTLCFLGFSVCWGVCSDIQMRRHLSVCPLVPSFSLATDYSVWLLNSHISTLFQPKVNKQSFNELFPRPPLPSVRCGFADFCDFARVGLCTTLSFVCGIRAVIFYPF